jgi:hypothetical protein
MSRETRLSPKSKALYLGALFATISREKPLGIIGFSYGARAVTGSLHSLGGGTLCGGTSVHEGLIPLKFG